jgi:hypothetical protein
MKFDKINDALDYFNLGTLKGKNLFTAYGLTDKGKRVWLPVIPENEEHTNILLKKVGNLYLILETGATPPQNIYPKMETAHVITRKEDGNSTEYEYIGEYKQVLFDKKRAFTVHVKVPFKRVKPVLQDGILWDNAFVSSLEEAKKKIDELYKEAEKISEQGAKGNDEKVGKKGKAKS